MGQQQLLLLVLGIVIVGLAVVVGIQAFGENQKKANADALVNDAVRIASDAQAWKLKPQAFGGGASASGFTGLSLSSLGYKVSGTTYTNLNGAFTVPTASASVFVIQGLSAAQSNAVRVAVYGTSPSCIATAISNGATVATPSNPNSTACTGS